MAQHRGHNEGTISKRVITRKDGTKVTRYIALMPAGADHRTETPYSAQSRPPRHGGDPSPPADLQPGKVGAGAAGHRSEIGNEDAGIGGLLSVLTRVIFLDHQTPWLHPLPVLTPY